MVDDFKKSGALRTFSGQMMGLSYDTAIRYYGQDNEILGTQTAAVLGNPKTNNPAIPASVVFPPTNGQREIAEIPYSSNQSMDWIRELIGSRWNYYAEGRDIVLPAGQNGALIEISAANLFLALSNGLSVQPVTTPAPLGAQAGVFKTYGELVQIAGIKESTLYREGPETLTPDAQTLLEIIQGGLLNETSPLLRDETFMLDIPEFNTERSYEEFGLQSNYVDLTPVYNYYLSPYEAVIDAMVPTDGNLNRQPEALLYNIYTFLSQIEIEDSPNPMRYAINALNPGGINPLSMGYKKYLNLGGAKIMNYNRPTSLGELTTTLKRFAAFQTEALEDVRAEKQSKFTCIGISIDNMGVLKEAQDNKNKFPMYNEVEILTHNTGKLVPMLKKVGIFDGIMKKAMFDMRLRALGVTVSTPSGASVELEGFSGVPFSLFVDEPLYVAGVPGKKFSLIEDTRFSGRAEPLIRMDLKSLMSQNVSAANILDAINNYGNGATITTQEGQTFNGKEFADKNLNIYGEKTSSTLKFTDIIKMAMFKTDLSKFLEDNTRSVEEVFKGKSAYSEVLFYEVVKYRTKHSVPDSLSPSAAASIAAANVGDYVQSIFIPNDPDRNVIKYIDTQVRYDKHYYYQVYAHTAVVGNEYKLTAMGDNFDTSIASQENLETFGTDTDQWLLSYSNTPTLDVLRVPYFNTISSEGGGITVLPDGSTSYNYALLTDTIILDSPPVFPNVDIVPYRGVDDRILINLNFSTGEYELVPVAFSDDERAALNKMYKSQKKEKGGPLLYKSDDQQGTFQILRTTKKPKSYLDFAPITETIRPLDISRETALEDVISPNTDYYYTFRAIDVHSNVSNPTPVYHVRMIAEKGVAPYLTLKTFFIEDVQEPKQKATESIMKYIKIQPAFGQSYLDVNKAVSYETAKDIDSTAVATLLPATEESVYTKKIKFRFTSKRTGRKFDLNVTFNAVAIEDKLETPAGGFSLVIPPQTGGSVKGAPPAPGEIK